MNLMTLLDIHTGQDRSRASQRISNLEDMRYACLVNGSDLEN